MKKLEFLSAICVENKIDRINEEKREDPEGAYLSAYWLVAKIMKKYSGHANRFCIDEHLGPGQTSHFKHAKFNQENLLLPLICNCLGAS